MADIVVLGRDPLEVKLQKIPDIRVLETIEEGESICRVDAKQAAHKSGGVSGTPLSRLLYAMQDGEMAHDHAAHGDGCPSAAILQLAVAIAGKDRP